MIVTSVIIFQGIAGSNGADMVQQTVKKTQTGKRLVAVTDEGKKYYNLYCLSCHQTDGSGVPGMYPPLNSDWARGDKKRLINVLLKGLSGEIEVNGETYDQAMPKVDYLTNAQIAHILTYVRRNFNNLRDSVTVQMVKAERAMVH